MRYSIDGQILTNMADAIREKTGKTKFILTEGSENVASFGSMYVSCSVKAGITYTLYMKSVIQCSIYIGSMSSKYTFDANNELWYEFTPTEDNENYEIMVMPFSVTTITYNVYYMADMSYTPNDMVGFLQEMPAMPTAEDLVITDNCNYRFSNGGWDWVVEKYGNMITTKDITSADYMFNGYKLENIPFDLNFKTNTSHHNFKSFFYGCLNLIEIPKINGVKPYGADSMFNGCYNLRELDYESVKDIDWSYIDGQTSQYGGTRASTFQACHSLRSFPMEFLNHGNPVATYSYSIFYSGFRECYALDEVINLPNPHRQANWTSNAFGSVVDDCYRLKNITFALNDGTPYVCSKWKNQTIDLSKFVGYSQAMYKVRITDYNSGITADKEVKDDATYQALKDDPDWYTADINYSRYNHDSAVATINSLPDCSALGGNTIKFKGAAGSATDGGAINTLTEEEIAVATAKGWTVSLV